MNAIVFGGSDVMLSACDRLDFQEFLEKSAACERKERRAIYLKGLKDGAAILKFLGVLA